MKKIKLSISQLEHVLTTENPKFPVEVLMKNIDQNELLKLGSLLQKLNKKNDETV